MRVNLPLPIEKLAIVKYPAPILRKQCAPVESFDDSLAALATRMLELMHAANGVGLAAPQVGVNARMFVCNPTGQPEDDRVWVNAELHDLEGTVEGEEGCLSLPGVNVMKRRAKNATITGCDVHGKQCREHGVDLLSRIWQHETDHLNGVLVIDAMSESAKLANKKVIQQLEADYASAHA